MDASALLQKALVASERFIEASAQDHGGSAVSVFAHLFAGPRRSGRTSLLQAVHDATAAASASSLLATKRANHFHSGGTPSQLMETVLQLERRIEYLKTQPTAAAAGGVKRHVLVVTVDDFDVLVALHRMISGAAADSASSGADGDDDGNAAGAGRFVSQSADHEAGGGTKSKALRDVWGCLFDYVHSDESSSSSSAAQLQQHHHFAVLLFVATTATAVGEQQQRHQHQQQQQFVPPASFLDAACAGLWIFPRGLTWQLRAPQLGDEGGAKHGAQPASRLTAASRPSVAALSLPLQTLAERSGCGAAFAELCETIFRFAVHAGVDAHVGMSAAASARAASPGAVARALEPPSGVLVYESGSGGCGRADLVAELGAAYARTAFAGALSTLVVEAPLLFGPIFGETEERIRGAFADAYARRPCVLFMHNIEAVAASRGSVLSSSSSAASGNVVQRAIATFLCEADGVDRPDRSSSVLLVGTTARRKEMDDAALRPGRLEQHLLLADSIDASEPQKQQEQQQVPRPATNLGDALSDSVPTFVAAWCESEAERAALDENLRRDSRGARIPIDIALRVAQQTILQNC